MRELTMNEFGFVSGGDGNGGPPPPQNPDTTPGGSLGCSRFRNPILQWACEFIRDALIMEAASRVAEAARGPATTVGVPAPDWPGAGAPPGGVPGPGTGHTTGG